MRFCATSRKRNPIAAHQKGILREDRYFSVKDDNHAIGWSALDTDCLPIAVEVQPLLRICRHRKIVYSREERNVREIDLCLLRGGHGLLLIAHNPNIVDYQQYAMSQQDAEKYGMSKPDRCPVIQEKAIRGNRTKTNERSRVLISESLAKQLEAPGEPAFPGTYTQWRERVNKAVKDAGVKTTPHGFRHYRITEWLSAGVRDVDVADMVGSSPDEIRKTYRHWIKETEKTAWMKYSVRRG